MASDDIDIPVARETIQSHAEAPRDDSSLYMHRAERTRSDGVQESVVTGVRLVFKAGHTQNLWEAFNVPRTQKLDAAKLPSVRRALLIACDTLEISGTLSLPEWDVAIFARQLIFRDQGNINTTPLDWTMARAADFDPVARTGGHRGAEGRHAGSFSVFAGGITEPEHESMGRFIGRGGRGQDAGLGRNGDNGKSLSSISNVFKHQDTGALNRFTATFDAPCVYATGGWYWGIRIKEIKSGVDDWPADGQHALEPGIPGSGGNGGAWVSNQKDLAARADTTPGQPGTTASSTTGGSAGSPVTSTHYDLTIRYDLAGGTPGGDCKLLEKRTTKDGNSFTAQASANGAGKALDKRTITAANAWVHPLQIECVLRYARDAFLAEAREDVATLLLPYERALASPLPSAQGANLPWVTGEAVRWTSAQAEVASILHRLRNQLDYFGNPAGYMPLLSLQATLRLYDLETEDALRTLLLASWVQQKADAEQSAANAFGAAITAANEDTDRVAEQLVKAEAKMTALDQEMSALQARLEGLSNELELLRTDLFNEAASDLHRQGAIKFGVKMAAAICQVIPVGQPVLGTIGKLASTAADVKEEGVPDTLGKMGDTIKKAREAAEKAKKAKDEAKKKDKAAADAPEAKKKAAAWEVAGKGLGTALSMAGEAIGALQVSEEEIDAELAKLVASSPKWKALTAKISALNKDKTRLFTELGAVLLAIGEGYARLASNADAVVTMQEERNEKLGTLSVEAIQVISRMGQSARLSLQRSLYLLVKAYETTVLKPIEVDWSLDAVLDKITALMKGTKTLTAADLNAFAVAVKPLFDENRKKIKASLLADYDFANLKSSDLEFGFTREQTAERLDALRAGQQVQLDPLVNGLILPAQERAKAVAFACKSLRFSNAGPAAPKSGNAILTLRTDGDGTARRGAHLYALRSDAPRVWMWTYHFSDRTLQASVPSLSSLDLLNLLLDSDSDEIKQKLAAPPAWSGLTLALDFSPPLAPERRPNLEDLLLICTVESAPSPAAERVLDVRAGSASARIGITPADLAGRTKACGDAYRVYGNGAKVSLSAPASLGDRPFSHWDVLDSSASRRIDTPTAAIVLDSDTLAFCRFHPAETVGTEIRARFQGQSAEAIAKAIGSADETRTLVALLATPQTIRATAAADGPRAIRSSPRADAPIIGVVPAGVEPAILEQDPAGVWTKVACDGVVGYVERAGIPAMA